MKYINRKIRRLYETIKNQEFIEEGLENLEKCIERNLKPHKITSPIKFGEKLSFKLSEVISMLEGSVIRNTVFYKANILESLTEDEAYDFFEGVIELAGLKYKHFGNIYENPKFKKAFHDYMITEYGKSIEPQIGKAEDLIDRCFSKFAIKYLFDFEPGILEYWFDPGLSYWKLYQEFEEVDIELIVEKTYKIINFKTT